MRIWFKIFKDNRMQKDLCLTDDRDDTRTHKIFHALDEACHTFDLGVPIWLDNTISDFLNAMARHVFIRTVLLNILTLTIWKFR